MKKKILIVINNLNCGGAEKALISLLETLDFKLLDVDLLLFKHEGIFFNKIPKEVNLLKEPDEFKYFDMSLKTAIFESIIKGRFDITLLRIIAGVIFKTEKNAARCEQRVWKYISKCIEKLKGKYDVAIGFLEKNPIYFCVDIVNADKKIGFIHNDYDKLGMDSNIDLEYFEQLDYLVTVSEECLKILKQRFPMFENKIRLMRNIISPFTINKMSYEKIEIGHKDITICSVGRLNYQKGFDMAIEACDILVKNGYKIKWYLIGEGEERGKLEKLINTKNLYNSFNLIGLKENPYPYIRHCDIYVQTSLFEGRCLTITEAKILKKPIVSTNFKVIYDQIEDEQNGLIVDQNPRAIYEGVKRLIDDQNLRSKLIYNLENENCGTESEIGIFYKLIS
ncbi:glycosyltransferase [Neobacillus sp. MER 74]|uniref:glycosyltransferase n=1 Tax=Neobacillus sp. MER 74 TaxID=2939566 RepID=UPI00203D85E0|nr:glycosyltransferase [Neobacillus sp. MER 74]MCM3115086.1 glycosyltransferase [Neobacillus sp. MER 74]